LVLAKHSGIITNPKKLYRRIKENQTENYFYVSDQPIPPVDSPEEPDHPIDLLDQLFTKTYKNLTQIQKLVGEVEDDVESMRKMVYGK